MYFGQRKKSWPGCQWGREVGAVNIVKLRVLVCIQDYDLRRVKDRCIGAIRSSAVPLTHLCSNPKVPGAEVLGGRTGEPGACPTMRTGQGPNIQRPV
jgi:hypothetical protein